MTLACFGQIILELTLKPFANAGRGRYADAATLLFTNWARLAERAESVGVMFWVGEGSDIFEWRGDLQAPLVWGNSIGFCNYEREGAFPPHNRHYRINHAVPYADKILDLRFQDLADIIATVREVGRDILKKDVRVGATIDPGPEFANSSFRFDKHPEILTPEPQRRTREMMQFITHQAVMHADNDAYAAFPKGIPVETSFGTFLGKQFAAAARELGWDFIWFSNGFAFSHFPWSAVGELFDGKAFFADEAEEEREKTNQFWSDFRAACDLPIEVRGTNFTVGMDLASDGCSHVDIFEIGRLVRPPCNPPWGSRALGLEMTSYLSRLAKTPEERLPFRFYLNDPWFVSNAWYDYYNRETFDIYVPMAAARLNDEGAVEVPNDMNILTVDTERGELIRDEANEATPHFIRALDERATAPGPVIWVYPFLEYDRVLKEMPERLNHVFHHDWFVCKAINRGLPVNTVCSADRIANMQKKGNLPDSVLVAPVPIGDFEYGKALLKHAQSGGQVLLYGSLAHASSALLDALGLTLDKEGIAGDLQVDLRFSEDRFAQPAEPLQGPDPNMESIGMDLDAADGEVSAPEARPLHHRELVDGGAVRSLGAVDDPDVRVVVRQDNKERIYAVTRARPEWDGGRLAWIHGSVCFDSTIDTLEPTEDKPWLCRLALDWPRRLLADFGIDIINDRHDESIRPANIFIKRTRGAWVFVGHKPNTSARFWTRMPDGAPLFAESETPIRDGYAGECFAKTFHSEVRAFVRMPDGIVATKEIAPPVGFKRHVAWSHLRDADVTLYPDPDALASGAYHLHALIGDDKDVAHEKDVEAGVLRVKGYTGTLYMVW